MAYSNSNQTNESGSRSKERANGANGQANRNMGTEQIDDCGKDGCGCGNGCGCGKESE